MSRNCLARRRDDAMSFLALPGVIICNQFLASGVRTDISLMFFLNFYIGITILNCFVIIGTHQFISQSRESKTDDNNIPIIKQLLFDLYSIINGYQSKP